MPLHCFCRLLYIRLELIRQACQAITMLHSLKEGGVSEREIFTIPASLRLISVQNVKAEQSESAKPYSKGVAALCHQSFAAAAIVNKFCTNGLCHPHSFHPAMSWSSDPLLIAQLYKGLTIFRSLTPAAHGQVSSLFFSRLLGKATGPTTPDQACLSA